MMMIMMMIMIMIILTMVMMIMNWYDTGPGWVGWSHSLGVCLLWWPNDKVINTLIKQNLLSDYLKWEFFQEYWQAVHRWPRIWSGDLRVAVMRFLLEIFICQKISNEGQIEYKIDFLHVTPFLWSTTIIISIKCAQLLKQGRLETWMRSERS